MSELTSLGDTSDVDAVKQAIEFDEIDRDATLTLGLKIMSAFTHKFSSANQFRPCTVALREVSLQPREF